MAIKLTKGLIKGYIDGREPVEVKDTLAPGLIFRKRKSGAHGFSVKRMVNWKDQRMTLDSDFDLDDARDIAHEIDRRIREKRDPWLVGASDWSTWYNRRLRAKRGLPDLPTGSVSKRVDTGPLMNWPNAVAEWLAELSRTRRPATVDSYRRALNVAELKPLHFKFVSAVSRQDVAEAVRAISERGKERQAESCLIAVKGLFAFLSDDSRSRRTGVKKGLLDDMEPPERTTDESDEGVGVERVPVGSDVGRLVRAFRDDESALLERNRLAALLTVYSVQRRRTVAAARVADFERVGDTLIWTIPPLHRKTASMARRKGKRVGAHIIPLPGSAEAVFLRAKELAGDSEHLFPSSRERRAGAGISHMDPSTITHSFAAVAGNRHTPHDMRRAFGTTFGELAQLALSDIKTILDHSEGIQHGDVTAEHYAFLTGTHRKLPIMRGWISWVDEHANGTAAPRPSLPVSVQSSYADPR